MRHMILLLAAVWAGATSAQDVASHYRRAIEAYQAGEKAAMLAETEAAIVLRPDSSTFNYLLAAALAWNGRHPAALERLARLERWGVSYQPDREPAFASLTEEPGFKAILAGFAENAEARGTASAFRQYHDGHFIPEGIAYHRPSDGLFLGSIRQSRILKSSADGSWSELVAPGAQGLLSVFGMRLVEDRLYVATSGMREGRADEKDIGRAGILVFNPDSGALLASHWLPPDDQHHVLGDLVVGDGQAYSTDSLTGQVWALALETGQWREIVGPGRMVSPQGLVLDPAGQVLMVADYRGGLLRIDLADHGVTEVATPDHLTLEGIDGLYRHAGELIAIQNGIRPHRVVRISLDPAWQSVSDLTVLARNLEGFDEPTLGTVDGDRLLFVANSQWPHFNPEAELPPAEELAGPLILALDLAD